MKQIFKLSSLAFVATLAACGGGGGSPGVTEESYSITLRADKVQLPLNVAGERPGIGVYAPYTTVLYVDASAGGRPIVPGTKDVFGCNISGGLSSGSLYYIDGDSSHEVEVDDGKGGKTKVPGAYRSITLGANSGGNSFHFSSGNQAGTAKITCTVTDPRDKQQKSASVDIVVGNSAVKNPASIRVNSKIPGYLGTKNSVAPLTNQVAIVALAMDDANQPIISSGAPNLQVSIDSTTGAATGARLVSGNQSGSVLQLGTGGGGTAQFSLLSGKEAGPIFLKLTADRFDNNVQNGIQDPITVLDQVYVLESLTEPLAVGAADFGDVTNGVPFIYMLEVQGGLPPYTWNVTGLPAGLIADSSGVISGTPKALQGTYRLKATVVDKNKISASADIALKLVGDHETFDSNNFIIAGCGSNNINQPCVLPNAAPASLYAYAFTASVGGVTWDFAGLPSWLKSGATGASGYISGTPAAPGDMTATPPVLGNCGQHPFFVTAKKGEMSVTRQVSITVSGGDCP